MQAFLFPGQGTQSVGMANHVLEHHPESINIYRQASEETGVDLIQLDEKQLAQTRFAQLAIVVNSVAYFEHARQNEKETQNIGMAGFSLGEYTALYAAGVVNFSDLLRLVDARARFMQDAAQEHPGAMFAIIGLDDATIENILDNHADAYPVNYNCPGQLVIAGAEHAVTSAAEKCKQAGAKRVQKLAVGGAFHTPLMQTAGEKLRIFAEDIHFNAPVSPMYSNATARRIAEDTHFPAYLEQQMISPVRFSSQIQQMKVDGFDTFTELGPGKVLSGLIRRMK